MTIIARPVGLATGPDGVHDALLTGVADAAAAAAGDPDAALQLAGGLTAVVRPPAAGRTRLRWEVLATLAAADLTVARVAEPHLDAAAILAEARADGCGVEVAAGSTWGVFASKAPPTDLAHTDGRASGTKAWCSLAGRLSHALVTADTAEGEVLLAVDLADPGVAVEAATGWVAHGLPEVTSVPIHLTDVAVHRVGGPDWYVRRPGFWWGGIGVAACWYGGAVGLARTAHRAAQRRHDDISALQLARIDLALGHARLALADAAVQADAGPVDADRLVTLAGRVRAVCAAAAETVLQQTGHLLGPGPLAFDAEHARRVADLTLYVRQHHADRDLVGIGTALRGTPQPW